MYNVCTEYNNLVINKHKVVYLIIYNIHIIFSLLDKYLPTYIILLIVNISKSMFISILLL